MCLVSGQRQAARTLPERALSGQEKLLQHLDSEGCVVLRLGKVTVTLHFLIPYDCSRFKVSMNMLLS